MGGPPGDDGDGRIQRETQRHDEEEQHDEQQQHDEEQQQHNDDKGQQQRNDKEEEWQQQRSTTSPGLACLCTGSEYSSPGIPPVQGEGYRGEAGRLGLLTRGRRLDHPNTT